MAQEEMQHAPPVVSIILKIPNLNLECRSNKRPIVAPNNSAAPDSIKIAFDKEKRREQNLLKLKISSN
jgi:hypothetical protein